MENTRKPSLPMAILIVFLALAVILWGGIIMKVGFLIPLLCATMIVAVIGLWIGFSWKEIEKGMFDGINQGMIAIIILLFVGILIGIWILSGTIPFLIYWGLKILTPSTFLMSTFIFCAIFSLATGTSFGTIGSAGIALLGVGEVLGFPIGLTVGAIVSGAFLGDKMSPVSDTVNVAAATTNTPLFKHISSMLYTTVPASILIIIIYATLSLQHENNVIPASVNEVTKVVADNFNLNVVTMLPPLLLIILSTVVRAPAIPTLVISIISGAMIAYFLQGESLIHIFKIATDGYTINSGNELIDKLLHQGGFQSMYPTVGLLMCALMLGGVLGTTKTLDVIVATLIGKIQSTWKLIGTVMISGYLMLVGTGNTYVGIIVTARAFKETFKQRGIQSRVLSRTLEDTVTLGAPLIPWSPASLFILGVLGVSTSVYAPYAFLCWIVPMFSFLYSIFGFAIFKEESKDTENVNKDINDNYNNNPNKDEQIQKI